MVKKINVYKDFAEQVGHRFRKSGTKSGEEFREDYLVNYFKDPAIEEIEINMDDTWGFPSSFLEETFGGLVRAVGIELVNKKLRIVSTQDDSLIERINKYIQNSESKSKK